MKGHPENQTKQSKRQRQRARALIGDAMTGVVIVPCEPCKGRGEIGLESLRGTCPACRGGGLITTNELEITSEADA